MTQASLFDFGPEWSDQQIITLMDGVLNTSLGHLYDERVHPTIKAEALEWLLSDDLLPFSFRVCCRALGYNADAMRDDVETILKRTLH